jgi:hypothetical protein
MSSSAINKINMSVDFQGALHAGTQKIEERQSSKRDAYVLHYSKDVHRSDGSIKGATVKELIAEFRASYSTYNYALIFRIGKEDKPIRIFNRNLGKKFFSLTRTRKGVKEVN